MTGHKIIIKKNKEVNYGQICKNKGKIIIYMGVSQISLIVAKLISNGINENAKEALKEMLIAKKLSEQTTIPEETELERAVEERKRVLRSLMPKRNLTPEEQEREDAASSAPYREPLPSRNRGGKRKTNKKRKLYKHKSRKHKSRKHKTRRY